MSGSSPSTDCFAEIFGDGWGMSTSQCVNASELFGQMDVDFMRNCAVYTDLASNYRANTISAANRSCLDNNHVDTSLSTAADVVGAIVPCLTGYCESSPSCRAQEHFPCLQTDLVTNGTVLKVDSVNSCVDQICAGNPDLQVNSDVAGIGLVTSYIIQISIVLLIALSLLFLTIWSKTHNAAAAANVQTWDRDEHLSNESRPRHDTPWYDRLYESLHEALLAFLLAQNFLALAMSIAALQTLNSPGALGVFDEFAIGTASGTIILPTVFGLYTLASFYYDSQSWYLFALSIANWILGFSIILGPQMVQLNLLNKAGGKDFATGSQFPTVCGNFIPRHLCGDVYLPDLHPEYAFYYTLCTPIMLGLIVWQLCSAEWCYSRLKNVLPYVVQRNSEWLWVLHLGAIGLFVAPCYFFFQSISDLFFFHAVNMSWDFGQIVAILSTAFSVAQFVTTYFESRKSSHIRKSRPRIQPKALASLSVLTPLSTELRSNLGETSRGPAKEVPHHDVNISYTYLGPSNE